MPVEATREKRTPVIVFGEVLFDNFSDGRSVLGGAPFNVAWSLAGFGRSPLFVSAVGDDAGGEEIKTKMASWNMDCRALQTDGAHPTGGVQVTIRDDEPSYEICENRAWDHVHDEGHAAGEILYHGLLALRSEESHSTLRRIAERSNGQRFFDINLRPPFVDPLVLKEWIQDVDWLKLNIDELRIIMDSPAIEFRDCLAQLDQLRREYAVRNVLLTGGSQGAIIHGEYGTVSQMPAPAPDPFVDTVGAGDSFSAATIEGILRGLPAEQIVAAASAFAARVCGLRGATTDDHSFYETAF